MPTVFVPQSVASPHRSTPSHAPAAAACPQSCAPQAGSDRQFIALLDAYRSSGGLARETEVAALFKRRGGPDLATLTRWVATRAVICFEWQAQTWLPLFQFMRLDLSPPTELGEVIAELRMVYNPWELANWFVQANPGLADRSPADALEFDLPAVLDASRAARVGAGDEAGTALTPLPRLDHNCLH